MPALTCLFSELSHFNNCESPITPLAAVCGQDLTCPLSQIRLGCFTFPYSKQNQAVTRPHLVCSGALVYLTFGSSLMSPSQQTLMSSYFTLEALPLLLCPTSGKLYCLFTAHPILSKSAWTRACVHFETGVSCSPGELTGEHTGVELAGLSTCLFKRKSSLHSSHVTDSSIW